MRTNTLLASASVCLLTASLAGCGNADAGQTTGQGLTVDQRIKEIEDSKAPQAVKDRTIADIKSHAKAYEDSKSKPGPHK